MASATIETERAGDVGGGGVGGVGGVRGPRPAPMVRSLKAYAPAGGDRPRVIDLKLDANEGPAPSSVLMDWLKPKSSELLRRYPSAAGLEAQIARTLGLGAARVVVTAGGDDALERIARAVLAPGREAILTTPTFEMIGRYATLAGADVVEVPWLEGSLDVDAIEGKIGPRTAAIFVVTPNNPTGQTVSAETIRRLSAAIPAGLLVVDLAYTEYADEDLSEVVALLPNAVGVRTFSKAWGLAGLRVGYAFGSEEVIGWLRAVGHPYAVSGPSLAIASAWFEAGRSRVEASIRRVKIERRELIAHLRDLGAEPLESEANFVLVRIPERAGTGDATRSGSAAHGVADVLAGLGIAVRRFGGGSALASYLRITLPGEAGAFSRVCKGLTAALRPSAVLFDMDGVIADVSRSYRRAIVETAAAFGVTLSAAEITEAKSAGNANNDWVLTQRLLKARGVEVGIDDVTLTFERFYQGDEGAGLPGLWREETLLVDRAWLEGLAGRYTLGIVTGRPRRDAERLLAHFGLADLFAVMVTMEDAPAKPDPRPVTLALERLAATGCDTGGRGGAGGAGGAGNGAPVGVLDPFAVGGVWMIGDTPDDLVAARRAGVVPIGVVAPSDRGSGGEGDGEGERSAMRVLYGAGAALVLSATSELAEVMP